MNDWVTEKFKTQMRLRAVLAQGLLVPEIIDLSDTKAGALLEKAGLFSNCWK